MNATHPAYIDADILAELAARSLEVQVLRAKLHDRGHRVSTERLYERLVHLEAGDRVRVLPGYAVPREWGAR